MLTWRQRATFAAHLYKAVVKQHHRQMIPLFRELIPEDGVVVDVGAHAGQFAKIFARLAPRGHVFAFEPGGYARMILATALRLRRRHNVTIVAAALGAEEGRHTLTLPLKASGSLGFGLASLADRAAAPDAVLTEQVPVTTLDHFAMRQGLARLDLVKADIEGWEAHMLHGAGQAIDMFRPAVLLEVAPSHLQRAGSEPREIWDYFSSRGYQGRRLEDGLPGGIAQDCETGGDYLFRA